jgi:hypothetical protein
MEQQQREPIIIEYQNIFFSIIEGDHTASGVACSLSVASVMIPNVPS